MNPRRVRTKFTGVPKKTPGQVSASDMTPAIGLPAPARALQKAVPIINQPLPPLPINRGRSASA